MEERRLHKRFSVEGIHGNILFVSEINIIDISVGGIAIETSRRLKIANEYTFRLEDAGKKLSLKGNVVWAVLKECKKGLHDDVIPF